MKRASFLCLLALGVHAASPAAPERHQVEMAGLQANTGETITPPVAATTMISAHECRAYAHTRDNVVAKPRSRRSKNYCNFDALRHRDA